MSKEKFKKIMGINAIVVNLLKNIQPIRRIVIQKYVTEQNGSAFLELFSIYTFHQAHCFTNKHLKRGIVFHDQVLEYK